jgi:hypothetical protein
MKMDGAGLGNPAHERRERRGSGDPQAQANSESSVQACTPESGCQQRHLSDEAQAAEVPLTGGSNLLGRRRATGRHSAK